MKLLTTSLREKLLANGRANRDADGLPREHGYIDHKPVVKLFTPDGAATWLLTEIDPDDPDRAFGLCDLGFGCPELGYVSLSELESIDGPLGLGIERDILFEAQAPLSVYTEAARRAGSITEREIEALAAAASLGKTLFPDPDLPAPDGGG